MKPRTHATEQPWTRYFPRVGELWNCEDRVAIICGNGFNQNDRIWIMDWKTGLIGHAKAETLLLRKDRRRLSWETIVGRFEKWAWAGNPDAMWWLAWWFEGMHHPRSIWTYIACLRADPEGHGWALERIRSDARTALMCRDVPAPQLDFLRNIPEMQGAPIGTDWMDALIMSINVLHIPVGQEIERRIFKGKGLPEPIVRQEV